MIRIDISSDDLAATRFAISPAWELNSLLFAMAGFGPLPPLWERRLRPAFQRLRDTTELDAMLALFTAHSGPDFVVPEPAGPLQTIEDDLAVIRATPTPHVRAEIEQQLPRGLKPSARIAAVLDSDDVVARMADALSSAWEALVAPDWPQLRAICERDIQYRLGRIASHGWGATLAGLNDRMTWRDGGLELPHHSEQSLATTGSGLLLVPCAALRSTGLVYDALPPRTLVYSARGIASLWEQGAGAEPSALAALIGPARARLLLALDDPASTTQLARSLALSVGAVGDNLTVMRRSGLLTRSRAGRSVLYRRTALGDAVAAQTQG